MSENVMSGDVCPGCREEAEILYAPWKALIATGALGSTVLQCTASMLQDLEQSGLDADDIWGMEGDRGLLIWEGNPVFYPPDDMEYEGTFRDLTEDEWETLRSGRELFPSPAVQSAHTCNRKEDP